MTIIPIANINNIYLRRLVILLLFPFVYFYNFLFYPDFNKEMIKDVEYFWRY